VSLAPPSTAPSNASGQPPDGETAAAVPRNTSAGRPRSSALIAGRKPFLECALVAGGAVRDRGGDQRLERVELGVGQQVVDHDEAVRAERFDLFSRHHFAHRPAFSMNAFNASL
jgi:hypothetical protein